MFNYCNFQELTSQEVETRKQINKLRTWTKFLKLKKVTAVALLQQLMPNLTIEPTLHHMTIKSMLRKALANQEFQIHNRIAKIRAHNLSERQNFLDYVQRLRDADAKQQAEYAARDKARQNYTEQAFWGSFFTDYKERFASKQQPLTQLEQAFYNMFGTLNPSYRHVEAARGSNSIKAFKRKAFRAFHPDLNQAEAKVATELTQKLSNVFELYA